MKKNLINKRHYIVSLLLVMAIVITGALAFLTATDSEKNTFTVGNVDIALTEPNWNPDTDSDGDGENDTLSSILPGETILKDPTITNTGTNDAYVYVMVEVPKIYSTQIKNDDGTTQTVNNCPAFSFEANDGWILVDSQTGTEDDAYDYYLYAYEDKINSGVSKTLFDEVKFIQIASTDEEFSSLDINITGYAIQSDFYNNEANDVVSAWQLFVNQNEWTWPDKKYDNLITVTYTDRTRSVLHEETVPVNTPVELYYDTSLAETGYYFSWVNSKSGETAYTNMEFTEDTTLVATYEETGYGDVSSNYLIYLLSETEPGHYSFSLVGVDVSNANYPSGDEWGDMIIPASIDFTMPNVTGTSLKAMRVTDGVVLFPANIGIAAGTTIEVPVEEIAEQAMHNYYALSSNEVTSYDCHIDNLVIPDSVKVIRTNAFAGSGTEGGATYILNTHMSYGVESIEEGAFCNNYYAQSVTLPQSLEYIGDGAFGNSIYTTNYLTQLEIPESVTEIGYEAFINQTALEQINIPASITEIKDATFCGCESVAEIDIHENITSIGEQAFAYCTALTNVEIGQSVTSIGDNAFESCDNLQTIDVNENNANYSSDAYGVLYNKNKTELITYPAGNTSQSYTVTDNTKKIADRAFFGASKLKSIYIDKSVSDIGMNAFTNCSSLTEVTFEQGSKLTKLSSCIFQYCTALKNIVIPDKVTTIGSSAFYGCTALESITVSDALTSIEFGAFNKCTALAEINYKGTSDSFSTITIKNNNSPFTQAVVNYI